MVNYKEDGIKFAQELIEKGDFSRSSYLVSNKFSELYNINSVNDNTNAIVFYNAWLDTINQKITDICKPEFEKFVTAFNKFMDEWPHVELRGDYDCNLYVNVEKDGVMDQFDL